MESVISNLEIFLRDHGLELELRPYHQIELDHGSLSVLIENLKLLMPSQIEIDKSSKKESTKRNKSEFSTNKTGTARVDAKEFDRSIQVKKDIVKNTIIDRSIASNSTKEIVDPMNNRLIPIEEHLGLDPFKADESMSIIERIKTMEDRIMELESLYPAFSAFIFQQPNLENLEFDNSNKVFQILPKKQDEPEKEMIGSDLQERINQFKSTLPK